MFEIFCSKLNNNILEKYPGLKIEFINQIWGRMDDASFLSHGDRKKSGMINNLRLGREKNFCYFVSRISSLRDFIFHLDIHCLWSFISFQLYIYIKDLFNQCCYVTIINLLLFFVTTERKRLRKRKCKLYGSYIMPAKPSSIST